METRSELPLTNQETIDVKHVCAGKSAKEAAHAIGVTKRTVDFHMNNIHRKLKIANRIELFIWAIEQGLVEAPIRKQPQGAAL